MPAILAALSNPVTMQAIQFLLTQGPGLLSAVQDFSAGTISDADLKAKWAAAKMVFDQGVLDWNAAKV